MTPWEMSRERFEELVAQALDTVPAELAAVADNLVVLVEDEPPPDTPGLLGLYVGRPLTERDSRYGFEPPDAITVFRLPTLRRCRDEDEVRSEVRVTVVHELAHHFGLEEDRLHELGWE